MLASFHYTNCTNPECGCTSTAVEEGTKCQFCHSGKRERDPLVPSLLIKAMDGETVQVIPVHNPRGTVRGVYRYEHIMKGIIRNMDTDNFYIDDSEFD